MNRFNLILMLLFLLPTIVFGQDTTTTVKARTGTVIIPGKWKQLNTMDDSGQTYLKNSDGVIIAVAQNKKKAYPCFVEKKSNWENVKLFYTWDSDYYKENKFKTDKLKEDSKAEYVIWKYNDGKGDNVFLFGSKNDDFLNLLVNSNLWTEKDKIAFLEKLYQMNK